jgi:hypothetical protein
MGKGVPVGYKHKWRYKGHWKETKVQPGLWRFRFDARKSRAGSAKGGLNVGQSLTWKVTGYQTVTKVSGRTYKTSLRGSKILKVNPHG